VPGFSVAPHEGTLRRLDAQMRGGQPFIAHSARHLIDARVPLN
jgi:hypothetical protein